MRARSNSRNSGNWFEAVAVELAGIRLSSEISRNSRESVENHRTEFRELDGTDSAMFNIAE